MTILVGHSNDILPAAWGLRRVQCVLNATKALSFSSRSLVMVRSCCHSGVRRGLSTDGKMRQPESSDDKPYIPVTIVGGGPVGLYLSNLLSQYQISHWLVEAKTVEASFQHPQAHFLNTRTMELLRTTVPCLYQRVRKAMPLVDEYQNFCFGYSLCDPNPLATVVHPVRYPLQLHQDANGRLQPEHDEDCTSTTTSTTDTLHRRALSPCTVGHLAQHKFAKILYDEALQKIGGGTEGKVATLQFGTCIERVTTTLGHRRLGVHTTCGRSWSTDLCVAVDGAHSKLRQANRLGNFHEQSLINVHVQLTKEQQQTWLQLANPFMLYTVLNESVVAMVVSHGDGEYVLQIPFFPPYQEPDVDFARRPLLTMLQAVFGFAIGWEQVRSVRPWTMTSWIASRYHNQQGLVWAGDAAHVFPPAGGFGLNTGLQDVHNLAWKICALFQREQHHKDCSNDNDDDDMDAGFVQTRNDWLDSYERERRPVAMENAALSVRNYERVLAVMNECYLNHKHPELAKQALDGMESMVTLPVRQSIFRSLMKTALQPLAWLNNNSSSSSSSTTTIKTTTSLYRQHVQANLRRLLKDGGGLPLLFPPFELGFCYSTHEENNNKTTSHNATVPVETLTDGHRHREKDHASEKSNNNPRSSDTYADDSLQQIRVGCRLPHAAIEPSWSETTDVQVDDDALDWSTIDLSTRLPVSPETGDSNSNATYVQPYWVLVVFGSTTATTVEGAVVVDDEEEEDKELQFWEEARKAVQDATELCTHTVYLRTNAVVDDKDGPSKQRQSHGSRNSYPNHHAFVFKSADPVPLSLLTGVALVRPDGHVVAYLDDTDNVRDHLLKATAPY